MKNDEKSVKNTGNTVKTTKNKVGSGIFDDIIGLPHHVSDKYPQMPIKARAAQFAPFAALVGHDEVIDNTADKHIEEWNETSGDGIYREEFQD